ncbi:MAG: hypothetical protein AAB483_02390 [Patescibacteria group bacterium]
MNLSEILSIIASLFNVACLAIYFRQLRKNQSIPNPATWLIWVVFTIMNFVSYFLVTDKNLWISSLSLVNGIGNMFLFLYSLTQRKFAALGVTEIISLLIAAGIGIYWKISGNAIVANVALQSILVISYYPTYAGLIKSTLRERPLSWIFSVIGYAILMIAVLLEKGSITKFALVFPILNVILNSLVVFLAFRQNIKAS